MDTSQVGPIQMVLAVVAFIAIVLLTKSARRFKIADSAILLAVGVVTLALLYATFAIQAYGAISGDVKIAHVRASQVANSSIPTLSVEVTLYGTDGRIESDQAYLVKGNEWMLQGDILKVSGLLAFAGLHSGYKLTRLEGRYDDPNLEHNGQHTVIELHGGEDGLFLAARVLNTGIAPFIDAEYGNAVFNGVGVYDIYVSQTSLWAKEV